MVERLTPRLGARGADGLLGGARRGLSWRAPLSARPRRSCANGGYANSLGKTPDVSAARVQELIEVNALCTLLLERLERSTLPVSDEEIDDLRVMSQRLRDDLERHAGTGATSP